MRLLRTQSRIHVVWIRPKRRPRHLLFHCCVQPVHEGNDVRRGRGSIVLDDPEGAAIAVGGVEGG